MIVVGYIVRAFDYNIDNEINAQKIDVLHYIFLNWLQIFAALWYERYSNDPVQRY